MAISPGTHWGYFWKYCPYSTNHRNKYYNNGFRGNTTNPDITIENFASTVTADHPFTDGQMQYKNNGSCPGWLCWDDACPYFIDNNVRYFEK
jgi:hypothetical protein